YQLPDRSRAVEQSATLSNSAGERPPSARFTLASTVAEYAEILKHTYWARGLTLHAFVPSAAQHLEAETDPAVKELVALMQKANALAPVPPPSQSEEEGGR